MWERVGGKDHKLQGLGTASHDDLLSLMAVVVMIIKPKPLRS